MAEGMHMRIMTALLPLRTGRLTAKLHTPDPVRLLFCFALTGAGAAVLLCRTRPALCAVLWLTQGLAVSEAERTLWDVCRAALLPLLALYGGILLSSFSACGQPFALLLLFSRGAALGFAAGACFSAYPVRDACVIAGCLILPFAIVSMLLLCCASRDALRMSRMLTGYLLHGTAETDVLDKQRKIITGMQLILLLILLAAAMQTALIWQLQDNLLAAG